MIKVIILYQSLSIQTTDNQLRQAKASLQVVDALPIGYKAKKVSEAGSVIAAKTHGIPHFKGFVNARSERVFNLAQGTSECYVTMMSQKKDGTFVVHKRNCMMNCSQKCTFKKCGLNNVLGFEAPVEATAVNIGYSTILTLQLLFYYWRYSFLG